MKNTARKYATLSLNFGACFVASVVSRLIFFPGFVHPFYDFYEDLRNIMLTQFFNSFCCLSSVRADFLSWICSSVLCAVVVRRDIARVPSWQISAFAPKSSRKSWSDLVELKTQNKTNIGMQVARIWKLTSWGFQKCGSFRDLEVLNPSYRLSKSGQIQKKK